MKKASMTEKFFRFTEAKKLTSGQTHNPEKGRI